ncbi:MAG: DUF2399 domain-containing protein [Deltaproteobacteria bacterium]|nr:DUF2399 domain-containing protein [Deltaproteobacteria bacterium]
MTNLDRSSMRAELLRRLLDKYERSTSYGHPGPWTREIVVRLDAKTFPEAFGPDGRERRLALDSAAETLAVQGALRIDREAKGPHRGAARAVRLGSAEVAAAYAAAPEYEALAVGLREVAGVAGRLARDGHRRGGEVWCATGWMADWLNTFAAALERGDPSALEMGRERFKHTWRHLPDALAAAVVLAGGDQNGWERFISERLFGDSKRLGVLRTALVSILVAADPRWRGVPPDEAFELLEAYGVRRKPGLIRAAGVGALEPKGCRLEDFEPVAHLPEAWAPYLLNGQARRALRIVTTVENEFPFLGYVERAGGPAALGSRDELVVYTAGFPTPALVRTLANLAAQAASAELRHWGDADLGGLRIWLYLRERLGRPVHLFRTTAEWVERCCDAGRPLSALERRALTKLGKELEGLEGPDVLEAQKLVDVLLRLGIKIEQEHFDEAR